MQSSSILESDEIKTGRRFYLGLVLFLLLNGVWNFNTVRLANLSDNNPLPWVYPLIWELTGAYTVFFLLPLLIWFERRFPLTRATWLLNLIPHLLASMVYSGLHTSLMIAFRNIFYRLLDLGSYQYPNLAYGYLMEYSKDFLSYGVFLGILTIYRYIMAARRSERRMAQLEAGLKQGQLQALKAQLNPHFLFNTLNMISSMMYEDVRKADKMIAALSNLLRMSLENQSAREQSLSKELAFLDGYIAIMKARFGEKLQYERELEDGLKRAAVPGMILQPLVENAIKHNANRPVQVLHIRPRARRFGDRLALEVMDNGRGLEDDEQTAINKGTGLSNTVRRLEQLYGTEQSLKLEPGDDGGLRVSISLPFREIEPKELVEESSREEEQDHAATVEGVDRR